MPLFVSILIIYRLSTRLLTRKNYVITVSKVREMNNAFILKLENARSAL